MESAKKLNFFPVQHGMSKYFSPRMIVHEENLDHNKHLKFALEKHTQALDELNKINNNKPRTLDCLFLHPNATKQGGCELLHLSTNKIIISRKI